MTKTKQELQKEIWAIQSEINKITEQDESIQEKYLKSLEWTIKCDAHFTHNLLLAEGLPTYTIKFSDDSNLKLSKSLIVYGRPTGSYRESIILNQKNYGISNWYGGAHEDISLATSNAELLIEFLSKHKFKSFNYDKRWFQILSKCNEIYS